MKKTVRELRESVLSYGFSPRNYAVLIDHWIDEAQRNMFRQSKLRAKQDEYEFTSVSGTKTYTLPSDFNSSISLRDLSVTLEGELTRILQIEDYDNAEATEGIPSHFIIDNSNIILYPTPNVTRKYSLRYNILPSAIAEQESSNPTIGEDYIYLIEIYCLYKAYQKSDDIEMANHYKGIYDNEMVEFISDVNNDTKDSTEQIQGAWSE